jgi:RNA polymerase sigma-70 factor (ECF subfamily)
MEECKLYDERQTVIDLSQGCEQAFERVYRFYSPRLYSKLFRILKSDALVQELLQDIFFFIWKNRQYINTAKSFPAYLFCIATTKAYDHLRKSMRHRKLLGQLMETVQSECNSIEREIIKKETSGSLHRAIALLPPKRRQVFMMCKVDGKSYNEVSDRLGISVSTISDHIVKANSFLKNYLIKANP